MFRFLKNRSIRKFINKINGVRYVDLVTEYTNKQRKRGERKYRFKVAIIKFIPTLLLILLGKWLFAILWFFIALIFFDHTKIFRFSPVIRIWFGVPGSGKSSMAALLSRFSRENNIRVLSNFDLKGAYKVDASDLGKYDMSFGGQGCHCILDEASSDFDNRNFKQFANTTAKDYFSFHRHQNNMVDVFSQGYDIDKRIRDRATSNGMFHLIKLPIKGFIMYRNIGKILFIKKDDKQIVDGFKYRGLPKIIFSRSIWDDFNTLDLSHCPTDKKHWEMW